MWLFIVFSCGLMDHNCRVEKTQYPTEESCGIRSESFAASLEVIKPKARIIYYCQEAALEDEQTP
jgi:hypothetical protein